MNNTFIQKYNVPGPRYTSYPTVPHWENTNHDESTWLNAVNTNFKKNDNELSLYIHLPFCESLCTYCGCSTHITKNHLVEDKYIDFVLKEWNIYLNNFGATPTLRELHLGGGTPTFFSPESLERLVSTILNSCIVGDVEMGFEGHPNNTTREHLIKLFNLGFKRVSFGVQDFDERVQEIINRKQPFEKIKKATEWSREIGYDSINYDLVYGLPGQTPTLIEDTITKTIELKPNRIAFYGYAHVPQVKPAQRSFEHLLPSSEMRLEMYESGKSLFADAGYEDIGMDHFALPKDSLLEAKLNGTLHRNFMGYTTQKTSLSIALGMSSISDSWSAFNQNVKTIKSYYDYLSQDKLPILKGHQLTEEDLVIRKLILDLMCRFNARIPMDLYEKINHNILEEMEKDGLIDINQDHIQVTETGVPFVRNVCMAFDARLNSKNAPKITFSRVV